MQDHQNNVVVFFTSYLHRVLLWWRPQFASSQEPLKSNVIGYEVQNSHLWCGQNTRTLPKGSQDTQSPTLHSVSQSLTDLILVMSNSLHLTPFPNLQPFFHSPSAAPSPGKLSPWPAMSKIMSLIQVAVLLIFIPSGPKSFIGLRVEHLSSRWELHSLSPSTH